MTILKDRPAVDAEKPQTKAPAAPSGRSASKTPDKAPVAATPPSAIDSTPVSQASSGVPAPRRPGPKEMTQGHKDAIASGRTETKAVRAYLEALDDMKPRRGRPRSKESTQKRLAAIVEEIPTAKPERRLQLIQLRIDLTAELASLAAAPDIAPLVEEFCRHAVSYGARHNISVQAWREVGVPQAVLERAGITR